MDTRLKRTPAIFLAGFMGCGKTTVGRLLADELGWDFIDLDRVIEAAENVPVHQIFSTRGEAEFRRIETETIRRWTHKIERGNATIIALGGGAIIHPGNFELFENHGISIWLDCPFEVLLRRLQNEPDIRPLARDPEKFRSLYEERRPGYGRAHYRIDAACEPAEAVAAILALPVWK